MDTVPPNEDTRLRTFQITYENLFGDQVTRILEATEVESGDLWEFWNGSTLVIAIREEKILEIHNVDVFLNN